MADFNDTTTKYNKDMLNMSISAIESISQPRNEPSKAGRYGITPSEWWSDPIHANIKNLTDGAFKLFIYLSSSPNSNSITLYRIPIGTMAADLKIGLRKCKDNIEKLINSGLIDYDYENEYAWIIDTINNQIRHCKIKPPNDNSITSFRKVYNTIPECRLKIEFKNKYGKILAL